MPGELDNERLQDLLIDPRERLDFELKGWLDLQSSNSDKATFAKAVIAIANHGGGFIAFGLSETDVGVIEADDRPATLNGFSQDLINGVIQRYCDPAFHCAVHIVPNLDGALFPIVVVPGDHTVPIQAKRSGPDGNIVSNNAIYVRKPGPRSETPQSKQDWDELLARCLGNRREELFGQIRDLISGAVPQVDQPPEVTRMDDWSAASIARWDELQSTLPEGVGARFPNGRYWFAYEISGDRQSIDVSQLPDIIRSSEVRYTGWAQFWYPTREGIAPYLLDGAVECWIGGDTQTPVENRDAAHSDFWRVHPDGLAFLMRGFQEDARDGTQAGSVFDVTLPVWRVGEALLHGSRLADRLFEGPTTMQFIATYEGLANRSLVSMSGRRYISADRVVRQNSITLSTRIETGTIETNLPEIVHPLLSPLYALFDFYDLPMQLVVDELNHMRSGRY